MSVIEFGGQAWGSSRPLVMGILNVTPDSFSDGGRHYSTELAIARANQMVEEGVDIIDVGGESTRPGARPVTAEEELNRVIPVIEALSTQIRVPVSIDTSKPGVMGEAVSAGASMVNDVMALRAPGAIETVSRLRVPVCLMHMQGKPRTMQKAPRYREVVGEIMAFLRERIDACEAGGISRKKLVIDPGFGFGKALEHNLVLLKNLQRFTDIGLPLLVGISRKSMIGAILDGVPEDQRLIGSVCAALMAMERGARILRVHDVGPTVEAVRVFSAVQEST